MSVAIVPVASDKGGRTKLLPAVRQVLVCTDFSEHGNAAIPHGYSLLRGGGHRRLTAGFALTRSWPSVVAGNLAAVAALAGQRSLLLVAAVVWLVDIVVRAVLLVKPGREVADV